MKVRYAVNDLVLLRTNRGIRVIAIEEIHGKHVRHKYGWQQVDEFHADVLEQSPGERLESATVRRDVLFCGSAGGVDSIAVWR